MCIVLTCLVCRERGHRLRILCREFWREEDALRRRNDLEGIKRRISMEDGLYVYYEKY